MVSLDERPENGLNFSVAGKRRRRGWNSFGEGEQAKGQAKEMKSLPASQNRIAWAHAAVVYFPLAETASSHPTGAAASSRI
jgi:hypothetical protein